MSSQKQIKANRSNALKSTGPGPQGKRVSSMNATKHGLFTKHLLVREEERAELVKFSEQLYGELQPQGPTETSYVERVISDSWRLRACLGIEQDLFECYRVYQQTEGDVGVAFAHDASQTNSLARVNRYASMLQQGIHRNLTELRKLQARPSRPSVQPPHPIALAEPDTVRSDPLAQSSGSPCQAVSTSGAPPLPRTEPAATGKDADPLPLRVLSQHAVLSDEDPAEFEAYRDALFSEWNARSTIKAFFIELFAVNSWRLARLSRVEAGLFKQFGFDGEGGGTLLDAFVQDAIHLDCFEKVQTCETRVRNGLTRILKELLA